MLVSDTQKAGNKQETRSSASKGRREEEPRRRQKTFETVGAGLGKSSSSLLGSRDEQGSFLSNEPSGILSRQPSDIVRSPPNAFSPGGRSSAKQQANSGGSAANGAPAPALSSRIQAKLALGPANDKYEQEADRTAEEVMNMPTPVKAPAGGDGVQREQAGTDLLSRQPLAPPQVALRADDEDLAQTTPSLLRRDPLQRFGEEGFDAPDEFEARLAQRRGTGAPLPDALRTDFEPKFGADAQSHQLIQKQEDESLRRQQQYRQMEESTQRQAGVRPDFPRIYGRLMDTARRRANTMGYEQWRRMQDNPTDFQAIFGRALESTRDQIRDEFLERLLGDAVPRVLGSPLEYAQGLQMVFEESQWNQPNQQRRAEYRRDRIYAFLLGQLAHNLAGGNIHRRSRINQMLITQTNNYREWERVYGPELRQWVQENVPAGEQGPGWEAVPEQHERGFVGQVENPERVQVSPGVQRRAELIVRAFQEYIYAVTAIQTEGEDAERWGRQAIRERTNIRDSVPPLDLENRRTLEELQAALLQQGLSRSQLNEIMSIIFGS